MFAVSIASKAAVTATLPLAKTRGSLAHLRTHGTRDLRERWQRRPEKVAEEVREHGTRGLRGTWQRRLENTAEEAREGGRRPENTAEEAGEGGRGGWRVEKGGRRVGERTWQKWRVEGVRVRGEG